MTVPHSYSKNEYEADCVYCHHVSTCAHKNKELLLESQDYILSSIHRDNGDGTHSEIPAIHMSSTNYKCLDCGATISGENLFGYTYLEDRATVGYHTYGDDGTCTVCGAIRPTIGSSIFVLPDSLYIVESQAFTGIKASAFKLPVGITSIAPDAFDPDAVLIVPNEEIAKIVQSLGWQFIIQ